jgi:hypothetical protein
MKKPLVLGILFILPLVIYLFFASGVNRFGRLPILTDSFTTEIVLSSSEKEANDLFQNKITVLSFLGEEVELMKGYLFNFNQKIYKRFFEFKDFQTLLVAYPNQKEAIDQLLIELGQITDVSRYKVLYLNELDSANLFKALSSDGNLSSGSSPLVYIVDKNGSLRGRIDDEDEGVLYGYDIRSVAVLNNKMEDDVKVLLAEYRLALKKNYADRK